MASESPHTTTDLGCPVKKALRGLASQNAELVDWFLRGFSHAPNFAWLANRPLCASWPPGFLFGLALAMRVLVWEKRGILEYLKVKLPSSQEILFDVFRSVVNEEAADRIRALYPQVLAVFLRHLAWSADPQFGPNVILGEIDEERFVDAVAKLLWVMRNSQSRAFRENTQQ
jgi:hypothetical protein